MRPGRRIVLGLATVAALAGVVLPRGAAGSPPAPPVAVAPGLQAPRLAGAVDEGPLAPRALDLTVVLPLRDRAGAEALVAALSRPGGPLPHRFLAPGEFAARFGADPGTVAAVSAWARRAGLAVESVSRDRALVRLRGDSPRVEGALGVRLRRLAVAGNHVFALDRDARLPAGLDGRVAAVLGLSDLDDLRPRPQADLPPLPGPVPSPPSLPLPATHLARYAPADFWKFYDAPARQRGAGQTIAVLAAGEVGHARQDLALFEARYGLPAVRWTTVQVGAPSTDLETSPEWDLDTQASTEFAPDVSDLLVYDATSLGSGDVAAVLERWIHDDRAPQASASFGECESLAHLTGLQDTVDALLLQAVAQGQSLFAASGDTGSFCPALVGVNGVPLGVPGPVYPASSAAAISVGGTTITDRPPPLREIAWKAGGGGVSQAERAPAFQAQVGGSYIGVSRGVPDVSLDADPLTGYAVVVDGKDRVFGGTSASSPAWLGIWARAQQAHGGNLGFANAVIYGEPAEAFHDIVAGTQGLHAATPGWDYCTGRGTPDIAAFVRSA